MPVRESMSLNQTLFDLGARLGSLEGYLYAEEKVEKHYLANWIGNIEREFASLPAQVRQEIAKDYREVLRKTEGLLAKLYGREDTTTLQVKAILSSLKEGDS